MHLRRAYHHVKRRPFFAVQRRALRHSRLAARAPNFNNQIILRSLNEQREARMLTGDLRNQIDGIWNDFWSGALANALQVIEQITYLIFIKRTTSMLELR
jgi:hypothetical protein